MKIAIQYQPDNHTIEFIDTGLEKRMWLYDDSQWYRTLGHYCPHLNIRGDACEDCTLALDYE